MPENSRSWVATIGGTVMGLITGGLSMYTWLEHRIESKVEAKVLMEVRISAIEANLKALESTLKTNKDAAWTADETTNKRIDDVVGQQIHALQERIVRAEAKVDGVTKTPMP